LGMAWFGAGGYAGAFARFGGGGVPPPRFAGGRTRARGSEPLPLPPAPRRHAGCGSRDAKAPPPLGAPAPDGPRRAPAPATAAADIHRHAPAQPLRRAAGDVAAGARKGEEAAAVVEAVGRQELAPHHLVPPGELAAVPPCRVLGCCAPGAAAGVRFVARPPRRRGRGGPSAQPPSARTPSVPMVRQVLQPSAACANSISTSGSHSPSPARPRLGECGPTPRSNARCGQTPFSLTWPHDRAAADEAGLRRHPPEGTGGLAAQGRQRQALGGEVGPQEGRHAYVCKAKGRVEPAGAGARGYVPHAAEEAGLRRPRGGAVKGCFLRQRWARGGAEQGPPACARACTAPAGPACRRGWHH
jgi:hypothetical protein